jgi:hypothetical protein
MSTAEDGGEKPTARAISERLVKLRQMGGTNGAKIPISKGPSVPSTPRKKATPGESVSGGSNKRKRADTVEPAVKPDPDADYDSSPVNIGGPIKRYVKKELEEISLADIKAIEHGTPSKRARKQTEHLNMTVYNDETSEEEKLHRVVSSSGSEFVPEETTTVVDQENVPTNTMIDGDMEDESSYYA